MSLSYCPSSILLSAGSSQMRRITLCAELTEWPYKWKQKRIKNISYHKPLKALHLFITSSLMALVNSKALLLLLLVLLQACFLHSQKTRCCCWQIDLEANTQILFFQRLLSVFMGHGLVAWEPSLRPEKFHFPFFNFKRMQHYSVFDY